MGKRNSVVKRETGETSINLSLEIDGSGVMDINSGIRMLDHLLSQLSQHGLFDIKIKAAGWDQHHLVEDVAIALGLALKEELPEKAARYGWALLPMDEALVQAAVDVGGRPYYVGPLPSRLYEHFLQSLAVNLGATLHIRVVRGKDKHHTVEAAVKAFGLALRQAMVEGDAVFSTKGSVQLEWGEG